MASQKYFWNNVDMASVVDSTNALTIQDDGENDIYTNVPGKQYNISLNAYETYSSHDNNPPFYHDGVSIFRNIKVKNDTITEKRIKNIPTWCNAIKIYVQIKNGNNGQSKSILGVNNSNVNHKNSNNNNVNDNFNHVNRNDLLDKRHYYNHHRHNNNNNNYIITNQNYNGYTNLGGDGSTGRKIEINKAISIDQTKNIKINISEENGISKCEVYISPKTHTANPPTNWSSKITLQSANGSDAIEPVTQNSNTVNNQVKWLDHNNNSATGDVRDLNVLQWDEAREEIADFHSAIDFNAGTVSPGDLKNSGFNHQTFKGLANLDGDDRNVTIKPSSVYDLNGATATAGTLIESLNNVGSGNEITKTDATITSNIVQIFYFLI